MVCINGYTVCTGKAGIMLNNQVILYRQKLQSDHAALYILIDSNPPFIFLHGAAG